MKTALFALCLFGLLATTCIAQTAEQAMAVTILKADLAGQTVVVKKLDGTEQKMRFARGTPVTSIAEAAISQRLSGGEGYQFLIRFKMERGEIVITAFDYVGKEAWKTRIGTVKVDRPGTILVTAEDGLAERFAIGPYCRVDTGKQAIPFRAWKAEASSENSSWIVRYMEVKGQKTAHLLEMNQTAPIVGVKIYDYKGDFVQLFDTFMNLGINTVFASETLARHSIFRQQAKTHNIKIFVIEPIFFDPEALKSDPDLYAITRTGERAKEDWVEFVCPSRDQYRKQKIAAVRNAVSELQPDGVSLDFIRFFVFWEMVRPDRTYESLPNTCFCPNCIAKFSSHSGIALPQEARSTPQQASAWIESTQLQAWTRWKTGLITSMAEELVSAAKQAKPGIMINLHAVPWRQNDYGGAIKKVAGQDFAALSRFAHFLSPMCYASMLHRDTSWIQSVVADIASVSSSPVLPSIQVAPSYPEDLAVSAAEFEEAVKAALLPPSRGVVFWSWDHLSKEPAKMDVLKRMFQRTKTKKY